MQTMVDTMIHDNILVIHLPPKIRAAVSVLSLKETYRYGASFYFVYILNFDGEWNRKEWNPNFALALGYVDEVSRHPTMLCDFRRPTALRRTESKGGPQ